MKLINENDMEIIRQCSVFIERRRTKCVENSEPLTRERHVCICCAGCGRTFGKLGKNSTYSIVCEKCKTENYFSTDGHFVLTHFSKSKTSE